MSKEKVPYPCKFEFYVSSKLARRIYSLKCSQDISAVRLFRFMCKGMALMRVRKRQGKLPTNQNLETLARQLYDYWFVQFDFPDENGKPYKSSGGAMVWNEQLKREIPKGWDYLTADKLTNVVTGKEDANFSVPNGAYPFFTCSRENLRCATPAFSGNAILIAGNGDFNVKHYSGTFNAYQRTYVLIPTDNKYYGVLYFSASDKLASFRAKSNGSIIKFITKGDIESIGVFDCKNENFYNQLNTLIQQVENNLNEIDSLIKQRNELLPLLMNGQVNFDLSVWHAPILYRVLLKIHIFEWKLSV